LFSDVSKTLSFRKRMKIKNLSLRLSKLGEFNLATVYPPIGITWVIPKS